MTSDSHGGSKAAWTAVFIIILGCLVSAVSLPLSSVPLFFVGVAVVVLGVVVGKVMSMMGLGQTVAYKDHRDPEYDDSDSTEDQSPSRVDPDDEGTAEPVTDEPLTDEPARARPTQEKTRE